MGFRGDESGVTSIEFAILALPFLILMFMILELAIVFYINAALDHASAQAARLVRTGQLQLSASNTVEQQEDAFLEKICEQLAAFNKCEDRVRVDLVTSDNGRFQPNMLPTSPRSGDLGPPDPGTGAQAPITTNGNDVPASNFSRTCPRDVVMMRTEFYHNLTIPGRITFLSNAEPNRRVLTSVTAFRNEPFPDPASYNPPC